MRGKLIYAKKNLTCYFPFVLPESGTFISSGYSKDVFL